MGGYAMKKIAAVFSLLLGLATVAQASITLLTEDTPPANYLGKDGKPAGLAVELVQEMARRAGDPGVVQVVPWARGYKDTLEKPNTALFHTVWTPERDTLFQWVGPLFPTEIVLYRKAGSGPRITLLEEAKKVRAIGVYKDDAKEQLLNKLGFTNLESTADDNQNPKKLVAGRIDLWPVNTLQMKSMLEANQIPVDAIEPVLTLTRQQAYLAFSSQTESREVVKWQKAFDDMEADGTADKIRMKYGVKPEPTIQIYTEDDPPRNYLQDGVLVGPGAEVVRQLLFRSTSGSRITVVSWARGYRETLENPNTALFSTARTPERENLFQWVGPISHTKVVFLARKGSGITIRSLADAKKVKAIGAYRDDTNEQFLKSNGFTNLDTDSSTEFLPKKLAAGHLDLWITPVDTASYLLRKAGLDPNDFEALFTVREFDGYLAVSLKTAPAQVQHWQETLDQMRKEGVMERILNKEGTLP